MNQKRRIKYMNQIYMNQIYESKMLTKHIFNLIQIHV